MVVGHHSSFHYRRQARYHHMLRSDVCGDLETVVLDIAAAAVAVVDIVVGGSWGVEVE